MIENINKFRDDYIEEVNSYEEGCFKNFRAFDKSESLFTLIRENESAIDIFNSYVNRPRIEEDEVKNLIRNGKIQEYKLKNQIKLLDGKLLSFKLIFKSLNIRI